MIYRYALCLTYDVAISRDSFKDSRNLEEAPLEIQFGASHRTHLSPLKSLRPYAHARDSESLACQRQSAVAATALSLTDERIPAEDLVARPRRVYAECETYTDDGGQTRVRGAHGQVTKLRAFERLVVLGLGGSRNHA